MQIIYQLFYAFIPQLKQWAFPLQYHKDVCFFSSFAYSTIFLNTPLI